MVWGMRRGPWRGPLRRVLLVLALCSVSALLLRSALSSADAPAPATAPPDHRPDQRSPKEAPPLHQQPPSLPPPPCPAQCPEGRLPFAMGTSLGDRAPSLCLAGAQVFAADQLVRGLNVAVLSDTDGAVLERLHFPLEESEGELVRRLGAVAGRRLVALLSWGDVAEKLSSDGRELLRRLGSARVADFRRGTSLALLGQVGLREGSALEKVVAVSEKEPDAGLTLTGCAPLPLGEVKAGAQLGPKPRPASPKAPADPAAAVAPRQSRREAVTYGAELAHCGLKEACPKGSFAFSAYSGKHKDDEPKMCVAGRFLVSRNVNGAGRGLNVVVVKGSGSGAEVLRVAHFDTYSEDSSTLEVFLEQVVPGELVAAVSFDEASNRLSNMAKTMLYELGSGQIQNLKFRASWFFVGQKGIRGFTPFEELNFAQGSEWAKPVDVRACVPAKLDGRSISPDPAVRPKNQAKRNFCRKYDGYEEFCEDARLDEPLSPAPLFNKSLEGHAIFKVPVLVVAGLAHNSLRLCLQTLLHQPGLSAERVLVTFDENYPEGGALASLFGFKTAAVPASASYPTQLLRSVEKLWTTFPEAAEAIVIEEELLLTADFLSFLGRLLEPFRKDASLLSVSSWNENGFPGVSSLPDAVYRVSAASSAFPGLGFLLKRRGWEALRRGNLSRCCERRVWEGGWGLDGLVPAAPPTAAVLVPDVSRVLRRRSDGLAILHPHLDELFNRQRVYSNDGDLRRSGGGVGGSGLEGVGGAKAEELAEPAYSAQLNFSIKAGRALTASHVAACLEPSAVGLLPAQLKLPKAASDRQTFVVYVRQREAGDEGLLGRFAACFGLLVEAGRPLRGLYRNSLRFSYHGRPMLLIGSKSPYYANKPFSVSPFAPAKS